MNACHTEDRLGSWTVDVSPLSPFTMAFRFVHGKPGADFLPNNSALCPSMIQKRLCGFLFVVKESLYVKF